MKVAIIYTEMYEVAHFKNSRKEMPPFGILYLSAIAEAAKAEVKIFKITPSHTSIDLRGFDIIAFSVLASVSYNFVRKIRFSSLYSGKPLIVLGGVHSSVKPEKTIVDFNADILVYGQGELSFFEILSQYPNLDETSILGICYKKDGLILKNKPQKHSENLDWLPLPSWHLFEKDDVILENPIGGKKEKMTYIMTSRGCKSSCKFCGVMQKKIQYRSGSHIRTELEYLINNYGIKGVAIVDDNFTSIPEKTIEICNSISDLGLRWSALSRADSVNVEMLQTMKKAGCVEIKIGVESGSNYLLNAMGKRITTKEIYNAINLAYRFDLSIKIFLMHGFPGENMETTDETISLLKTIRGMITKVSLTRFVPLPGSYVFNHPSEFDLHNEKETEGNYERCFMYNNHHHWWGNDEDFTELNLSYQKLVSYLKKENIFET